MLSADTADVITCYKHHSAGVILSDGMRIRLLTAQRDMYISGFVLFLFLYVGMRLCARTYASDHVLTSRART